MLKHQNPTTNPSHPFPDDTIRQHADVAATALMNRVTLAKRVMETLPEDADNATAVAAFNEMADAIQELHRLLMLGWWADQPF
jgi:hypothetical protein